MCKFNNWSDEDLNDLDAKFDALCEHLGIEFVFERVSDGSDAGDRERCYARVKGLPPLNAAIVGAVAVPPTEAVPKPVIPVEPIEAPYEEEYKPYKKKKSWD